MVGGWVSVGRMGSQGLGSTTDELESGGVHAVSLEIGGRVKDAGNKYGMVSSCCMFPCDRHPPRSLQWCLQRWWVHAFRMHAELQPVVRHLTRAT